MSSAGVLAEHYICAFDVEWFPTVQDIGPCPPVAGAAQDWEETTRRARAYKDLDYATREQIESLIREGVAIAHQRYQDASFRAAVSRVAELLLNDVDGLDMEHPVVGDRIIAAIEAKTEQP